MTYDDKIIDLYEKHTIDLKGKGLRILRSAPVEADGEVAYKAHCFYRTKNLKKYGQVFAYTPEDLLAMGWGDANSA